jgi:hypothetical protein
VPEPELCPVAGAAERSQIISLSIFVQIGVLKINFEFVLTVLYCFTEAVLNEILRTFILIAKKTQ